MLDPKLIRQNPEAVREALKARKHTEEYLDKFLALDSKRKQMITEVEGMKAQKNVVSDKIAVMKRNKEDASDVIKEMQVLAAKIKELDAETSAIDNEFGEILLNIPNMTDETTPYGQSEDDNVVVKTWGEPKKFDFEPKPHWDIAKDLDIIDLERGAKIAGSGFIVYKGLGSKLKRSLISFFLDLHTTKHGYTEIFPPFLVNANSMTGTGQLPKFEEDMYKCDKGDELYAIPTAEVPVTNLYSNEILSVDQLPIKHCAYSAWNCINVVSFGLEKNQKNNYFCDFDGALCGHYCVYFNAGTGI